MDESHELHPEELCASMTPIPTLAATELSPAERTGCADLMTGPTNVSTSSDAASVSAIVKRIPPLLSCRREQRSHSTKYL